MSTRFKYIFSVLLKAQEEAIKKIAPGVSSFEIDQQARNLLAKHGLAKYFIHGIGHGVGKAVHEEPLISQNRIARLEKGMVLTIEPAVYLPNWGGIRIEDMVLVTSRGCEVLSTLPKKIFNI